MNRSLPPKQSRASISLLEAAREVLLSEGYSGLSTRAVAAKAGTQMSQIRYYFGSKEGMVLAMYEYLTEQLIERQEELFNDPTMPLSRKWDVACDYLDKDLESGYVGVLHELIAVGWSNPVIGETVSTSLIQLGNLHTRLAREFEQKYGPMGPFDAEDIGALAGPLFIGAESYILLGCEEHGIRVRRTLRRFGKLIRMLEV